MSTFGSRPRRNSLSTGDPSSHRTVVASMMRGYPFSVLFSPEFYRVFPSARPVRRERGVYGVRWDICVSFCVYMGSSATIPKIYIDNKVLHLILTK
jgi:hypothetical protein